MAAGDTMGKILVADDEVQLQELIKDVLSDDGHTVLAVSTGTDVIPALRKESPDLLILDVMLPALDGYAIQEEMSKDPLLCRIPVVVITAQQAFLSLFGKFDQVAARLSKPFTNQVLTSTVRAILERRRSRT